MLHSEIVSFKHIHVILMIVVSKRRSTCIYKSIQSSTNRVTDYGIPDVFAFQNGLLALPWEHNRSLILD